MLEDGKNIGGREVMAGKWIATALVALALTATVCLARYSGGTGEPNDPYRIATPNDLNDIGNHVEDFNKFFVMVNDINLGEYTGTEFNIIGPNSANRFTGVFDGNDKRIWNFRWSSADRDLVGLFGLLDGSGHIRNLGMENVDVNAANGIGVGSLVGRNSEGTITNCYSQGRVGAMAVAVGGLVGYNSFYNTITDCYWTGSVDGNDYVGGLVGYNRGTIANCYSTGSVSGREKYVGGLVGKNIDGTISDSHSTVVVAGGQRVGGLAGDNDGMITKCWSTGSVSGRERVGGLVGSNGFYALSDCYCGGRVDGNDYVGALVGYNDSYRTMTNCYSRGSVDANNNVGALVGYHRSGWYASCFWDSDVNPDVNGIGNASDPNVIGKPTPQMQTESTFTDAGWDFVEVWDIGEGQTYPFLREYLAGDSNHDGIVDWADYAILASQWLQEKE
ncbi:MAG: GLUG motif-containing protein [Planctomycetota bacterium]|jgi:hypothetical protein